MATNDKKQPLGRIRLNNVRLAFPNLFTPKAMQGEPEEKARYSASFLMAPDHPQVSELNKLIDAVGAAKWGDKAKKILETLRATDKVALHDGDTKEQYDGFEGNLFLSAASPGAGPAPTVLGKQRETLSLKDGVIYAGCYVNASVELWAQSDNNGKRINARLRGVQFVRDGDAFAGGRPADADEFEDVEDEGADAEEFV